MAHEIETMFAVGQKTWHGLEKLLETPPLTVEEVLFHSGMGLEVVKVPAKVFIDGTLQTVPDLYAVVREDGTIVGHCGEKWRAFQDKDFVNLLHSYVDAGLAEWETGGVLSEGQRVFGLLKLKIDPSDILPGDTVYPYILGTNGHTSGISTALMPTVTRVVCANTLKIAQRNAKLAKLRFTVRHSQLTKSRVEDMKREVDAVALAFSDTTKLYSSMASFQVSDTDVREFFAKSFGKWSDTEPEKVAEYFTSKQGDRLLELFERGKGSEIRGVRNTLWGAYNAVTEYLTHESGRTFSTRFESGNFGLNSTTNQTALNIAQDWLAA